MNNSSIEITDQEYLIKLPRQEFTLSFIHKLLKRIETEQFFTYGSQARTNCLDGENDYVYNELRFDDLRDK